MKAKIRDFWAEDRLIFILLTGAVVVGLAAMVGFLVPQKNRDAASYTGIATIIVAGYAAGWARAVRSRARTGEKRSRGTASLGKNVLRFVSEYAFLAGLAAYAWESGNGHDSLIRLAGAICFLMWSGAEIASARSSKGSALSRNRRHVPVGVAALAGLAMAFELTTPQPHRSQPAWLTALGIVLVVGLIATTPYAVIEWIRRSDERESLIANRSLAFAFIVTMTLVLTFSLLEALKVGPSLRPDYVIATATTSWFGAWFVLQRRM